MVTTKQRTPAMMSQADFSNSTLTDLHKKSASEKVCVMDFVLKPHSRKVYAMYEKFV